MIKLIATAALAALVSTSAFAQSPRANDVNNDQTRARVQAQAQAPARTTPEEGRRKGSEMSQEKFQDWQTKKRQCYLNAGLTEGTEFRTVDGGMKFQVNSRVHLDGSPAGKRRSAAVDVCDGM